MSAPVRIRRATVDDVPVLASFNAAMALETEGKALDSARLTAGVAGVFAEPARGEYWVAEASAPEDEESDERILGALMLTYEWSDWRNGTFWWIQSVYVRPEVRGRGIYAALYRAIRARAEAAPDVAGIRLYVDHENTRAQQVYAKLGMRAARYRFFEVDFVLED